MDVGEFQRAKGVVLRLGRASRFFPFGKHNPMKFGTNFYRVVLFELDETRDTSATSNNRIRMAGTSNTKAGIVGNHDDACTRRIYTFLGMHEREERNEIAEPDLSGLHKPAGITIVP